MPKTKNEFFFFFLKYIITSLLFLGITTLLKTCHKETNIIKTRTAAFLENTEKKADSILTTLTIEQKIEQLIFFDAGKIDTITFRNKTYGGIFYTTDSLKQNVEIALQIQKNNNLTPLVALRQTGLFPANIAQDFPNLETVFATNNDTIIKQYTQNALEITTLLGANFVFLPKFLYSPNDTIFNLENKNKLINYVSDYQDSKLFTCIKSANFFQKDSVGNQIDKAVIKGGLSSILLSEINDTSVFEIQKNIFTQHQFTGITLAKMPENTENLQDTIFKLLNFGAEMFFTKNPEKTQEILKYLLSSRKINEKTINQKAKKIIQAKLWAKANKKTNIDSINLIINSLKTNLLNRQIQKKSITLLKNTNNILPFTNLKNKKFQIYIIGENNLLSFTDFVSYYSESKVHFISTKKTDFLQKIKRLKPSKYSILAFNNFQPDSTTLNKILFKFKNTKTVFVNFRQPKNLNLNIEAQAIIQVFGNNELSQQYAAEVLFGGISAQGVLPIPTKYFPYGKSIKTKKTRISHGIPEEVGAKSEVLSAIDSIAKSSIRRGVFPGCQVFAIKNGQILWDKSYGYQTYSRGNKITSNDIYDIASLTKIAATTLAAMKMFDTGKMKDSDLLGKFFKDTKIEYTRIKPDTIFNIDTLYIADIKNWKKLLTYQDTLNLNDSMFVAYDTLIVTATPKNNIFKVNLHELLIHASGISPALPILPYLLYRNKYWKNYKKLQKMYEDSLANGFDSATFNANPREDIKHIFNKMYSTKKIKDSAEVQIADHFYLRNNYFDTLWRDTKQLRVYSRKIYQYSDINMILLQQAIDSANHKDINKFLQQNFYKDLGLKTIGYQPLKRFNKNRIVPTENEKFWRKQLLRGYVHDPSAALLGGISGNAGLFTNAHDLAIIGQLWLNGGNYGGKQFLKQKTILKFTKSQKDSHRGLGFDKPGRHSIIGQGAPKSSYGHTGFTGTCLWVDPENEIVYVFLSNRVHPSAKNWRINSYKVRQKIHTAIYQSLK